MNNEEPVKPEETEEPEVDKKICSMVKADLESRIGFSLDKQTSKFIDEVDDKIIVLPDSNIVEIKGMTVQNSSILDDINMIDYENGIIYFNRRVSGIFIVEYSYYNINLEAYETFVKPLLKQMYDYHTNDDITKTASTVKEGEVSITYDSNLTEGAVINSKIETLKKLFKVYSRLI